MDLAVGPVHLEVKEDLEAKVARVDLDQVEAVVDLLEATAVDVNVPGKARGPLLVRLQDPAPALWVGLPQALKRRPPRTVSGACGGPHRR